jgi:ATP-dependent RNA helicase DDX51/DBP6
MIVCDSSRKPLMLFHLVHSIGITDALVFTKSAESTLRLVRLFEFFEVARTSSQGSAAQNTKPVIARAYSSDLSPSERKSILDRFRAQEIDMLKSLSCLIEVVFDTFLGSSVPTSYHAVWISSMWRTL